MVHAPLPRVTRRGVAASAGALGLSGSLGARDGSTDHGIERAVVCGPTTAGDGEPDSPTGDLVVDELTMLGNVRGESETHASPAPDSPVRRGHPKDTLGPVPEVPAPRHSYAGCAPIIEQLAQAVRDAKRLA